MITIGSSHVTTFDLPGGRGSGGGGLTGSPSRDPGESSKGWAHVAVPIVDAWWALYVPSVNLSKMEDFPTAASPTNKILKRWS